MGKNGERMGNSPFFLRFRSFFRTFGNDPHMTPIPQMIQQEKPVQSVGN